MKFHSLADRFKSTAIDKQLYIIRGYQGDR